MMNSWWSWPLFGVLIVLVSVYAGLLRREAFVRERQLKEAKRTSYEAGYTQGKFEGNMNGLVTGGNLVLSAFRHAHTDVRFQLNLFDWAEFPDENYNPEMRWRWTITDADKWMKSIKVDNNELPALSGESSVPFMLGNAPTRALAEAEALAWIESHDATSVVL